MMDKTKLSTRQASLIIFIAMLSTKLLSLNSIISYHMLNNAWFVFFVSLAIDFLFAMIFIHLINKIDIPIFDYIKQKFGKTVSIIISILVAIMFLFKTVEIMVDIYLFFVQLIYVEINRIVFITCFVLILFYFGSRKLQSLGRSIELLIYLIIFSLALSIAIALNAVKFENLLPFLNINIDTTIKSIVFHNVWFGDFWFIFFMIGNIKKEKDTSKKLMLSYIISSLVIIVFVLTFTSVFGLTAPLHRVCVIDITEVSPRLLNQARFNWIVDFIFPIVLVLGLGLHANVMSLCIQNMIKDKLQSKNTIGTIIMIACVLSVDVIFRFTFTGFYRFITNYFFYANTVIQYLLPIILLLLFELNFAKNNEKIYKNNKKIAKNA